MIDTNDLIGAFARNLGIVKAQAEGLTNADSLIQSPIGNCLNWVVGHIVEARDDVLEVLGEPRAAGSAVERYQRGSEPVTGEAVEVLSLAQLLELLDRDRLVSRACAEGTAGTTNARLIVVKDSGHFWPLQNRDTAKHILVESLADELAPDSLGILLSKAVARHARVNPRIATQATLEASPLYSQNSLAQALTPLAAFWEKGVPSSEPRVSWSHRLMPRPAPAYAPG